MEYFTIVFIIAFIVITAIVLINSNVQANKKLKELLVSSFGTPPSEIECELASIRAYSSYLKSNITSEIRVDDITWNDLNMDEVFKRINICLTSIGEECLYNCLHELQFESTHLMEREKAIEFFSINPEERLSTQLCLARLGKVNYNGLVSLIFDTNTKLFKHPFVFSVLSVLPLFCASVLYYSTPIGIGCILLSYLINLVVYYKSKLKVDVEIPAISYFASALSCCRKLCNVNNIETLPAMVKIKKLYETFRPLEGKLPIGRINSGNPLEVFYEYFNIMFLIDIRNYNKFMKMIIKHNDDFYALYKALGEIDLALCISSFRKSLPVFSTPEFHEQNIIEFEELFHPLIPSPVKNTGAIMNSSLITGSNASGKSTFIKTLAINGILAQTINSCTAAKFKTRFSLILTSMAMRDDISSGDSYFVVELKSLKRILDLAQKYPCICYIDEILRGTNTIERIASSASVLRFLKLQNCLCVVASHDIELVHILVDKFDNYHFCEQVTNGGITFDYLLKHGASTTRNAIKLLSIMGYNSEIVIEAEKLTSNYDKNNKWC